MWWRVTGLVRAATGDDGTGAVWPRLTPDCGKVIDLAFAESRELGHPCMAGEHVLLAPPARHQPGRRTAAGPRVGP
jgi:hypothetical protein